MTELVRDDPERSRYELVLDGTVVGRAEYVLQGDTVVFTHTEVDEDRRNRGLAARLVAAALDDVRARGRSAEARCRYVQRFIDRNPAYADLLAA